jgi:ribosomal protein S18 acetylase RimI-like enzyme
MVIMSNVDQHSFHRRLEEAILNSWPALEQVLIDGWVVRFGGGFTRRANSITPLYTAYQPSAAKLHQVEELYAARGLPTIFRLTDRAGAPDLDVELEQLGYAYSAGALVMTLDLNNVFDWEQFTVDLSELALDDWLAHYDRLYGSDRSGHDAQGSIIRKIPTTKLLAGYRAQNRVVACGIGVIESEFLGLFNILTGSAERGRGYGKRLLAGLLAWGRAGGARCAHLQVAEENKPALALYTGLGFRVEYRYWYRQRR